MVRLSTLAQAPVPIALMLVKTSQPVQLTHNQTLLSYPCHHSQVTRFLIVGVDLDRYDCTCIAKLPLHTIALGEKFSMTPSRIPRYDCEADKYNTSVRLRTNCSSRVPFHYKCPAGEFRCNPTTEDLSRRRGDRQSQKTKVTWQLPLNDSKCVAGRRAGL